MKFLFTLIVTALLNMPGTGVHAGERPVGDTRFAVVINHEEQYSIWKEHYPIPRGWQATGFVGDRQAALRHIEKLAGKERRELALKLHRELAAEYEKSP